MFNRKQRTHNKEQGTFKKVLLFVFVLVLLLISFFSGMYVAKTNEMFSELAKKETVFLGKVLGKYSEDDEGRLSANVDFGLYWDLWDALKERYVDKDEISDQEMFYGSLRGLARSLGDPYTMFLDPKDSEKFNESLTGIFEGIGAEVGMRDDVLTIIAPLDGMPAQKAGLLAGDKVFSVDGESTLNMTIDEAVNKIRGERGTKVVLTIFRDGLDATMDIEVERGIIQVKSVTTEFKDDGIFVMKISNFNDETLGEFNEAVRDILVKDPKGLIVDLRNNPGGYLRTAIEVASEWIDDDVVVIEKISNGEETKHQSLGTARLRKYPTVVLVNIGSASASEIVAGALKDYELATIIGGKTFGKGSVQALESFRDGSYAKITVAKWLTPKGNSINDEGITPDEEIEYTIEDFKEDRDPQMDRAVEILKLFTLPAGKEIGN